MRSPLRLTLIALLACAGAAAAPASRPDEKKPATLAEAKAEEQQRATTEVAGLPLIEFENRDFSIPDAVVMYTTVSFAAGQITVAQMSETLTEDLYSVQLIQQ